MIAMCDDFPAPMDNHLIKGIHPDEWANVGPSIIHFSTNMLQEQQNNGKNFIHIKEILTTFITYVIRFIKQNDLDSYELKEKIKSNLM